MPPVNPGKTTKSSKVRVKPTQARHAAAGKLKPPAPRTDVQSSGGDYGTKQAETFKTKQAVKSLPKPGKPLKRVKGTSPFQVASSTYAATVFPAVTGALAAVDKATGSKSLDFAKKTAGNIPKDAAELAVTTPSSLAKLATTTVHHPSKVPGMLLEFPKQLYHHPGQTISEHPVTTALMVAPAVKMPGRAAGRAMRVAGKQTLERPPAVLPHTPLKEARTGARGAVTRAVQARKDEKAPQPTMTTKQIEKRVDEFYDFGKQHTNRASASAAKRAKTQAKAQGLPRKGRRQAAAAEAEGARQGAPTHVQAKFGREFGSTWERTPTGIIVKPKNATEGALHDTRAAADAIAQRLNAKPTLIKDGKDTVPLEFKVVPAGAKFAVVPKMAAERLRHHRQVGTSPTIGAATLRTTGRAFRASVLPLSQKWLTGQGVEAGLRSAITGAGPFDLLRMKKIIAARNEAAPTHFAIHGRRGHLPNSFKTRKAADAHLAGLPGQRGLKVVAHGAGDELLMRVTGGQFGLTGTAREFANGRTLADEFSQTPLKGAAKKATEVGQSRPLRVVRRGWARYTGVVMDSINGAIENNARLAMAGQAVRRGPLMERHLLGLSDKALKEAADGLTGTEAQVRLAREVDRMYGKYQKFGPHMREQLLHWTPFLPWYLNVATFLTKLLPVDHPVKTALIADVDKATEEWRKSHELSFHGDKHLKGFLLGSYPSGKGPVRLGQFTPFGGAGNPVQAVGDLVMPQAPALGPLKYAVDWTGLPLKYPGFKGKHFTPAQVALYAAAQQAGVTFPGLEKAGRITGLEPRYIEHKDQPSVLQGKSLKKALLRELPFTPTATPREAKPKAKGSGWGGGSSSGKSGWGGSAAKGKTGWGG